VRGMAGDWVGSTRRSGIHGDMEGELCPSRARTGEGGRVKGERGKREKIVGI
jgi:hypothetical protein